jgi:CHAD domain-containing protein
VKARAIPELDPSGPLLENAARIVQVRLDELRGFAEAALAPDASEAQHDMRIAAKRLRYLLEIFAPCLGDDADAARRAAKQLQSVLGEIHDCDVMLPKVAHIASLVTLLRARREHRFHEFVALWQAEASRGTWTALEQSLR